MAKKAKRKHTPRRPRVTYDEAGYITSRELTPEEWKSIQTQQAELAKARRILDRTAAIRDGLVPPPWAEKLLRPINAKPTDRKEGPKERRVKAIFHKLWPNGFPPELSKPDIVKAIGDAYGNQYNKETVSRQTILRSLGFLLR